MIQDACAQAAIAIDSLEAETKRWPAAFAMWALCRIDYHLATPGLAALAKREALYKAQKFSDHAPLTIDYDFDL